MHVFLGTGGAVQDAHARKVATNMELPNANHDELALVWEAIGRQILPIIRQLYTSKNDYAACYAARTGLRLGDKSAVHVLLRFARYANSPLQIPAIRELGRHTNMLRAVPTLRELIDDENERVRIAAYESLAKHGDSSVIRRVGISGGFTLDVVASRRNYVIYATQTRKPRIILFGRNMAVRRPVFFTAPDDLVTINAIGDDKKLTLFRKIPVTGKVSEPFYIDFKVRTLVRTMGSLPRRNLKGDIEGVGLTYGQVISVLYRMCKEGDIPARFVLQELPDVQRMYQHAATVGRPDMPGK